MNWSNWGVAHVFAWKCICAEHGARCGLPFSHRRRTYSCNLRRLFPLSLLVDAAKRQRECRTGRLSAAAQDRRALCGLPVGTPRPIGGVSDTGNGRTSPPDRKAQRRGGAEKGGQEARGSDERSPRPPRCERATKSILGLCLITPVIRLSPLVLIAEPQKFSTVLKSAWRGLLSSGTCRRSSA
jgi:hypothetical protein